MNENIKKFYKCEKFEVKNFVKKPLFFYHVPKCAGTTLCIILSHLFKTSHRLKGTLFENNDKGGETAYNYFLKNKKNIINKQYEFIFGHVPIEIHEYFKDKYFFVSLLRDPIERTISHYNWSINRNFFSRKLSIEELFINNKLPSNIITNQFAGKKKFKDNDRMILEAINNLKNKIDIVVDVQDISTFIKEIISCYNLPNVFFQNQNTSIFKNRLKDKEIEIIKKYNKLDILLYNEFKKTKKEFNKKFSIKVKNEVSNFKNIFLYSSPHILINGKKNIIIEREKLKKIIQNLKSKNFKIIEI